MNEEEKDVANYAESLLKSSERVHDVGSALILASAIAAVVLAVSLLPLAANSSGFGFTRIQWSLQTGILSFLLLYCILTALDRSKKVHSIYLSLASTTLALVSGVILETPTSLFAVLCGFAAIGGLAAVGMAVPRGKSSLPVTVISSGGVVCLASVFEQHQMLMPASLALLGLGINVWVIRRHNFALQLLPENAPTTPASSSGISTVSLRPQHRDVAGVMLLAAFVMTWSWWLIEGQRSISSSVRWCAVSGAALFLLFVLHERKTRKPLIIPGLITSRPGLPAILFLVGGMSAFFCGLLYLVLVLMPFTTTEKTTPIILTCLIFSVGVLFARLLLNRLPVTSRVTSQIIASALVLASIGWLTAMFSITGSGTSLGWLAATALLLGVATGAMSSRVSHLRLGTSSIRLGFSPLMSLTLVALGLFVLVPVTGRISSQKFFDQTHHSGSLTFTLHTELTSAERQASQDAWRTAALLFTLLNSIAAAAIINIDATPKLSSVPTNQVGTGNDIL